MLKNFLIKRPDINNKTILVTGGTGSFGNQFVQTVIDNYSPKKLIIFSRDELKQYEMAQKFSEPNYPFMRYFIGDVRDYSRLEMALRGVDIVIHAAALKHVTIAEYNPYECINTNVIGAENLVRASLRNGVQQLLALSTDKAVSPINLYGASKLAAEKIFIAANNIRGADPTIFSVVRYGNVVGSRGSVVPFFKKLLNEGAKSLPITDNEMTRFWITLQQGVDFVLSNLALMQGGEIFIPKIPSMKITDLVEAMQSGIATHEIGIRPGEKLHECMVTSDEALQTVEMDDRYVMLPSFMDLSAWQCDIQTTPVGKRMVYSSNTNSEWLNTDQLTKMIGG
jgi:UDP-N-acetylglucosamine 4,6-dehydratase/5-epimerase